MNLLTQGEIETRILRLGDEVEEETYRYAELSDAAAEAEADYKVLNARALVALAADKSIKLTAAERAARVDLHCAEQLRTWKIAEARRQASREALLSMRARLDSLRTLSANVRHAT